MVNPLRTLALAVLRQALIDYVKGEREHKVEAERFLKGEGRKLWESLGLRIELLDALLENPAEIGRTFFAGRQVKR